MGHKSPVILASIGAMAPTHTVIVHHRDTNQTYQFQVPEDRYILHTAESQGVDLPFSCRNGACTSCAVRVLEGDLVQPEHRGQTPDLRKQGYALLCVSYARSDLRVETQDEDEVYDLQFGRHFGRGKVRELFELSGDLLLVATDRISASGGINSCQIVRKRPRFLAFDSPFVSGGISGGGAARAGRR
jgi:ferredoxin